MRIKSARIRLRYENGRTVLRPGSNIFLKDSGVNPLIEYRKSKRIHSRLSRCIVEVPLLKAAFKRFSNEKVPVIVSDLQRRKSSKPRTEKTLAGTISSLFQKQLSNEVLNALSDELTR